MTTKYAYIRATDQGKSSLLTALKYDIAVSKMTNIPDIINSFNLCVSQLDYEKMARVALDGATVVRKATITQQYINLIESIEVINGEVKLPIAPISGANIPLEWLVTSMQLYIHHRITEFNQHALPVDIADQLHQISEASRLLGKLQQVCNQCLTSN